MDVSKIQGPWTQHGKSVYFAGNNGGFDLSGCAYPIDKARLAAAAPELLAELRTSIQREYNSFEPENQTLRYARMLELLAKVTGAPA